ncbi:4,5-DOPA dioxygenase extradiol [Flavipsychrobacter stenotrophus]|uniref:4,5-DOPA dioxygenase extradiol n=2 Tax=Flavipsychrobacter stenotrophus TaxID=2077091 RepID=A0A2S7SQ43_9BACT|nr:4,5-DOPA dioxygenase extradiol [Flavipsychrobacter stenotrophus]
MSTLSALESLGNSLAPSPRMPVMFIGHGSPMNAIEDNEFSQSWRKMGKQLPRPQAILSISAHWLTNTTKVTTMAQPKTIHDFGGFPKALFDAQYPAPGAVEMANLSKQLITASDVQGDDTWGLDHGTWSVLLPMYPAADIPVFQLSLVYDKSPEYHYQIGQQLLKLRDKGVLILGSGNLVHNLGRVDWHNTGIVYDWAKEFDSKFTSWIDKGDHASIMNYQKILGATATMTHPTYDHLLPLFYILGLQQKNEKVTYFNDTMQMGSISMRSLIIQA